MDCNLEDSCCSLDDVAGDAATFTTFRTAAEPDLLAPEPPSFVVTCTGYTSATTEWSVAQAYDPAAPDGLAGSDVFMVRYFGRRATEPESAVREVARRTFQTDPTSYGVAPSYGESPLGRVDGRAAIVALAGDWLVYAEAVDFAGNVSARSETVSFTYPDFCDGDPLLRPATGFAGVGGSGEVGAPAAGAGAGADHEAPTQSLAGGGCGCGVVRRQGLPPLFALGLGAVLVGRRRRRPVVGNGS